MGFFLCINTFVILCAYVQQTKTASIDKYAKKALLSGIYDLDESGSEELLNKKAMKKYHKEIERLETKYYIKQFQEERKREEKDQVEFFDNLLQTIKKLNSGKLTPDD